MLLQHPIEHVFPLFGAFEERKWADNWNPVLLYPDSEVMDEGVTFQTAGLANDEPAYTWIVKCFQPARYAVEYLVYTSNRYWTISVSCTQIARQVTEVHVTYTYTPLNKRGQELNVRSLDSMFQYDLRDWQEAIDHYLETGLLLKANHSSH